MQKTNHSSIRDAPEPPKTVQLTRWSLVARAYDGDDDTRQAALNTLLETYLPVLQWYLTRHTGLSFHEREDLVQGFVARKVLDQGIVARADRGRGRFRSFLLGAFQNYIRDELRRQNAAKRVPPGGRPLPLEEADGVSDGNIEMERELKEGWLRQVVAQATTGMKQECNDQEREDVWTVFRSRLLDPMLDGEKPEPYDQLVTRLGLKSPTQASNLLVTAKRMFARHLKLVVAETVDDPEEAEEELRELQMCL